MATATPRPAHTRSARWHPDPFGRRSFSLGRRIAPIGTSLGQLALGQRRARGEGKRRELGRPERNHRPGLNVRGIQPVAIGPDDAWSDHRQRGCDHRGDHWPWGPEPNRKPAQIPGLQPALCAERCGNHQQPVSQGAGSPTTLFWEDAKAIASSAAAVAHVVPVLNLSSRPDDPHPGKRPSR